MRQLREVVRQKWGLGLSNRQVVDRCGVSRPTVTEYMRRTDAAGLSWSLSKVLDNTEIDQTLFFDWRKSSVAYSSIHCAKFIRLNRS